MTNFKEISITIREKIQNKKTYLGIEFGSTRIKAALKLGVDILFEKEQVSVDKITGHGGLFKTRRAAQQFLADGLGCAVSVMKTARSE